MKEAEEATFRREKQDVPIIEATKDVCANRFVYIYIAPRIRGIQEKDCCISVFFGNLRGGVLGVALSFKGTKGRYSMSASAFFRFGALLGVFKWIPKQSFRCISLVCALPFLGQQYYQHYLTIWLQSHSKLKFLQQGQQQSSVVFPGNSRQDCGTYGVTGHGFQLYVTSCARFELFETSLCCNDSWLPLTAKCIII